MSFVVSSLVSVDSFVYSAHEVVFSELNILETSFSRAASTLKIPNMFDPRKKTSMNKNRKNGFTVDSI